VLMLAFVAPPLAAAAPPYADKSPQKYDLTRRASEIDPRAKAHPEIDFLLADKQGKPLDLERAVVDTRVPPRGKLVIWLMGHSPGIADRVAGYGMHYIQVHYANKWFGLVPKDKLNDGTTLGKIRLEAATGEDVCPIVDVPKPDGMAERASRFVRWLATNHLQGNWGQFLTADGQGLQWELVTVSGSSHGSTTAARFAVHQKVGRVVMFCGPRDQYEGWQGFPSATPPERFFGFSHVLDGGWTGHHYCRSWEMLGLNRFGPIVDVETGKAPFGNTRRLTTSCDVKNDAQRAHGIVVPGRSSPKGPDGKLTHEDVWEYLFTHPVTETGAAVARDAGCKVAPPGKK
jgi:hypothetical protein